MKALSIILVFFLSAIWQPKSDTYQAVRHDSSLSGEGSDASPLGVNRGTTITTASIGTAKDDYAPTGWDDAGIVRLTSDNLWGITGFVAPTASDKPQSKKLFNIGSNSLYFPQDHPSSSAANRFTGWPGDFILLPGKSCTITYDGTSTRWRIEGEQDLSKATSLTYKVSAGSATAGDHPEMGMLVLGSGTLTTSQATSTRPASYQLNTNGSSTGGYSLFFMKGSGLQGNFTAFNKSHTYVEVLVSIPTLSDGTNTYTFEVQFTKNASSTSLENNNTVAVRYSHSINSGEWELFSQDNAGAESTPADLNVAVATNTLYRIALWTDKANTETRAYVNGTYVGRVTSNRPATDETCGARVVLLASAGSSARLADVHSFSSGAIYQ